MEHLTFFVQTFMSLYLKSMSSKIYLKQVAKLKTFLSKFVDKK